MSNFKPGQRWICDADLQLGLGTIIDVKDRIVTVSFKATGEIRSYARQSAPLTRVTFSAGDAITTSDGCTLTVQSIIQSNDLLIYSGISENGHKLEIIEEQLAHSIQFNQPAARLLNGFFDSDKWFQIRYQTWLICNRFTCSPLHGLIGSRTSLIPHQLYIAHEVARRYAPRVLLADEVGLGKTIEAGLILHQQLLTERIQRVLIVVPETLIHQWMVEMLRRFNLHFSIFDETRYRSLEESDSQENPFHSEQLTLCSLSFLTSNPDHFNAALEGHWDLLVVDEAHHLQWSEQTVSQEYFIIEQLAARIRGVLLLTATPEQLGKAGHFARLRLLDPHRFANFEAFIAEEQSYEPIARAVEVLLSEQKLDDRIWPTIRSAVHSVQADDLLAALENTAGNVAQEKHTRDSLAELLLDRHGTGRILFRNTRATIKGFPERRLAAIPLPLPKQYHDCLKTFETTNLSKFQLLLCPELLYQARAQSEDPYWTTIDPRINWLHDTLKQLKPGKVLVITAHSQTARDIAKSLKILTGQHIPVFHEQMSLIERDRAAAFFADKDTGSQLLICSEIGSEGRNFQFSHHLVLFDLPLNPDLLEQRIGRLDRIGQTRTINLYVPYLEDSAQAVMHHWYHLGLNAFEKNCLAGQAVFSEVESALKTALHHRHVNTKEFSDLISNTQSINQILNEALDCGRDRLLEYNSFRPLIANKLHQLALSQEDDPTLPHYMDRVFDCFGIHTEDHRTGSHLIQPGEHMTAPFPGLSDEGTVITYRRDVALANEDMSYLTWEHPMVTHAIDRILSNESGNAAVTTIKHPDMQPGTVCLESLYILETGGYRFQQGNRYLPPTMLRIFIDERTNQNHSNLEFEIINKYHVPVTAEIARQVIQLKRDTIKALIDISGHQARSQTPEIMVQAHRQTKRLLTAEIERLRALQKINPSVREEEIQFFEQELEKLTQAINSAQLRLDALRIIIAI